MCHYARVLIELDLQKEKEYNIMYERSGHSLLPQLDTSRNIGHSIDKCRTIRRDDPKDDSDNKKAPPPGGPSGDQNKKKGKKMTRNRMIQMLLEILRLIQETL